MRVGTGARCQETWLRAAVTGETRSEDQACSWERSPALPVTPDRWRVCLNNSARQLSSACRRTGVYSSSLLPLGVPAPFPVAPGAHRPG